CDPFSAASALLIFRCPSAPGISTLSLHDALPISGRSAAGRGPPRDGLRRSRGSPAPRCRHRPRRRGAAVVASAAGRGVRPKRERSEEHTSELQSRFDLVCRLLLEKKKENGPKCTG